MKYTINLSKDIITEESLNTMIKEIDSSYESCSKAIEDYNLISNVKAMAIFGYKATEGLGESIKNGAKAIWEKIKEFFKRISILNNKLITDFIVKIRLHNYDDEVANKNNTFDFIKHNLTLSSKNIYEASNKILKKLNTDSIKSDNSKIKMYQDLEKNTYMLNKVIRQCAKLLVVFANYQKQCVDVYKNSSNYDS